MTSRTATTAVAVIAGLVAGILSVSRVLLGNGAALSNLVWAEDGLFPLCVKAHGPLPCLMDPWAGYFLFVPRFIAWPVSWVPLDHWPLATNISAALLAAGAAAVTVVILRASGSGVMTAGLVGLLPAILPIMGFEAINTTGSVYMLLIYVAAIAISFPPESRMPTWAFAAGALVTALTMPSSAILFLPLAVQVVRRRVTRRSGLIIGVALLTGLVFQAWVALTAANPRQISWTLESLRQWAEGLLTAVLTFVPHQVRIGRADDPVPSGAFASDLTIGRGAMGLALALLVLVLGLVLVARRGPTANGVGLLLLVGLAAGALPAVAGYANNRYYVIPILLWSAAGLIALDRWVPGHREVVLGVVAVALVTLSLPSLSASPTRSTAVPEWHPMLADARASCSGNPDGMVAIVFSPSWPFADAVFPGPTNNVVPCSVIR